MCRYAAAAALGLPADTPLVQLVHEVGLYKLNAVDPRLGSAWS